MKAKRKVKVSRQCFFWFKNMLVIRKRLEACLSVIKKLKDGSSDKSIRESYDELDKAINCLDDFIGMFRLRDARHCVFSRDQINDLRDKLDGVSNSEFLLNNEEIVDNFLEKIVMVRDKLYLSYKKVCDAAMHFSKSRSRYTTYLRNYRKCYDVEDDRIVKAMRLLSEDFTVCKDEMMNFLRRYFTIE